jgi:hypothetical protein
MPNDASPSQPVDRASDEQRAEPDDYRGVPGGYTATAKADLMTAASTLPIDFPNYADWPVTLPAGHWRAIIAALASPGGRT